MTTRLVGCLFPWDPWATWPQHEVQHPRGLSNFLSHLRMHNQNFNWRGPSVSWHRGDLPMDDSSLWYEKPSRSNWKYQSVRKDLRKSDFGTCFCHRHVCSLLWRQLWLYFFTIYESSTSWWSQSSLFFVCIDGNGSKLPGFHVFFLAWVTPHQLRWFTRVASSRSFKTWPILRVSLVSPMFEICVVYEGLSLQTLSVCWLCQNIIFCWSHSYCF